MILLGIVAVIAIYGFSTYNSLVSKQTEVEKASANVQSAYQRRADLVPNLVETVKGYAKHEEETLKAVVEARAKATQMQVDLANATPEQIKEFQKAQSELGGLSRPESKSKFPRFAAPIGGNGKPHQRGA